MSSKVSISGPRWIHKGLRFGDAALGFHGGLGLAV